MTLKVKISIFLLCSFFVIAQENYTLEIKAKIEVKKVENILNINGFASNLSNIHLSLTYNMLSLKKAQSGNVSSSRQSGKFTLSPNEKKIISESSINLEVKDAIKIYLFINDEKSGKLISKDSLEINADRQNISYETQNTSEDEIQLTGIIIDETKTKLGETFYSKLYNDLQLNSISLNFMVKILELPTFNNRSTQLQIFAQDTQLLSFNILPDEEYIDSIIRETINTLLAFKKQKEILDKTFNY